MAEQKKSTSAAQACENKEKKDTKDMGLQKPIIIVTDEDLKSNTCDAEETTTDLSKRSSGDMEVEKGPPPCPGASPKRDSHLSELRAGYLTPRFLPNSPKDKKNVRFRKPGVEESRATEGTEEGDNLCDEFVDFDISPCESSSDSDSSGSFEIPGS